MSQTNSSTDSSIYYSEILNISHFRRRRLVSSSELSESTPWLPSLSIGLPVNWTGNERVVSRATNERTEKMHQMGGEKQNEGIRVAGVKQYDTATTRT